MLTLDPEVVAKFDFDRLSPSEQREFDWLLLSLERDVIHTKHSADPLRFALDILPHHFTLAIATLHRRIVSMAFPGTVATLNGLESRANGGASPPPCSHPNSAQNFPPTQKSIPDQSAKVSSGTKEASASERSGSSNDPLLLALAAPRGFAKSTLLSFLLPTWSICQDRKHFIILISNTQAQAKKFLQMVRYEFETNGRLKKAYPELTPNKVKWSDEEIELKRNGKLAHKIVAIGAGAQLRGLRFLQYRPDLIILDDVENEEMVDSEIRREDLKAWLDRTVLHVNAKADVVVIGTVLHEMSLLNRVVRQQLDEDKRSYSHWTRKVFQSLELNESTWEAYQSTSDLETLRKHDPEAFMQEKQNEPLGLGYKSFDKPEFWTEQRFRSDWPSEMSISITCDPASTNKEYSDETAIIVAGWDSKACLWVIDMEHNKYTEPDQIIDRLLFHWQRWTEFCKDRPSYSLYAMGIGKIAFQKYLMDQFKQSCKLRKMYPYVVQLKEDRDKTRRIRQLVPLFTQNRIFLRPEQTYLEQQLRAFPKGRYDDCGDALTHHLQFGHILPTAAPDMNAKKPKTTFKDYIDMAEEWKLERERLAPFNAEVTFVPMLHNGM